MEPKQRSQVNIFHGNWTLMKKIMNKVKKVRKLIPGNPESKQIYSRQLKHA